MQETSGFFFCLQDRALLCRKCDVAIHTVNSFVSAHQRFLLTGVKVGLEPADPGASSSSIKSLSGENILDTKSHSLSKRGTLMPVAAECKEVSPTNAGGVGDFAMNKVSFAGGSEAGSTPSWHMDDFLALPELNQNYGFMDNGSSKVVRTYNGKSYLILYELVGRALLSFEIILVVSLFMFVASCMQLLFIVKYH